MKKASTTKEKIESKIKPGLKKKPVKKRAPSLEKALKPYLDFLGIPKYNVVKMEYYSGEHEKYLIEADFLETFVLKIFSSKEYKYNASIEKHFFTSAKNIRKLTPTIIVPHDPEKELNQFLFTDRLPGANKKWSNLNAEEKSRIVKNIARVIYKFHTYSSQKTMKESIFGRVSAPVDSWEKYLQQIINKKLDDMSDNATKALKFKKYCEGKMLSISAQKIIPNLLHGSLGLNKDGVLRSFLFIGDKMSGVMNTENSIYGDKIMDLVFIQKEILAKDINLEKDFYGTYGKLRPQEKERLEFYTKILE